MSSVLCEGMASLLGGCGGVVGLCAPCSFDGAGASDFLEDVCEGWDIFVPFDERGYGAEAIEGFAVNSPYIVDHRPDVRVDDVFTVVCVSSEMELADTIDGDGLEVGVDGEAVVKGADVDVVDIQEDLAVGALGDLAQEVPFGEFAFGESDVARDIFEQDLASEGILDLLDARDDVADGFFGVGEREKVVAVVSTECAPAQVIRDPRRLEALFEGFECVEVFDRERVGIADAKGDSVHYDRAMGAHPLQHGPRAAPGF